MFGENWSVEKSTGRPYFRVLRPDGPAEARVITFRLFAPPFRVRVVASRKSSAIPSSTRRPGVVGGRVYVAPVTTCRKFSPFSRHDDGVRRQSIIQRVRRKCRAPRDRRSRRRRKSTVLFTDVDARCSKALAENNY